MADRPVEFNSGECDHKCIEVDRLDIMGGDLDGWAGRCRDCGSFLVNLNDAWAGFKTRERLLLALGIEGVR